MDIKKIEMLTIAFVTESEPEPYVFSVSNESSIDTCKSLEQDGYLEETFGFIGSDGNYYKYFSDDALDKCYKLTDKGREYCKACII